MVNIKIDDLQITDSDMLYELTNGEAIATYGGFLGITINPKKILRTVTNVVENARDFAVGANTILTVARIVRPFVPFL